MSVEKESLAESYRRTDDFESRIAGLQLQPEVWAVFAQFNKPANLDDVIANTGLASGAVADAVALLVQHGLLCLNLMGWQEFLAKPKRGLLKSKKPRRSKKSDAVSRSPIPAAADSEPEASVVQLPVKAASTPPGWHSRAPMGNVVKFVLRNESAACVREVEQYGLIQFAIRREPGKESPLLKPILDAIVHKGGGGVSGQLLAYRVFLKVPVELMRKAGIRSLSLVDGDFRIDDPRLYDSIRVAAREVARLELSPLAA